MGNHLLERGIADEKIRQAAGCRLIRARKFRRRRRSIGFGIPGIGRHVFRDLGAKTDGRVETSETVRAVKRGSDFILQANFGNIVTG